MRPLDLVILVLAVAVAVLAWVVAVRARLELRVHRAQYRHTPDDLLAARRDSLARSHAVVTGKVSEHLSPLFPAFAEQFEARDARFLGSPVDFVVFDGLDRGEVERVVFVEVKTGGSALSSRERRVRDAVEAGRVEWQVLRLPGPVAGGPATAALEPGARQAPHRRRRR